MVEQIQLWQSLTTKDPSLIYITLDWIQSLRRTQKNADVRRTSRPAMVVVLVHGR